MNAFVAITDRDWFDFLARQEEVDEVNFWQPSAGDGRFRALGRGEPFLFKLRAPVRGSRHVTPEQPLRPARTSAFKKDLER